MMSSSMATSPPSAGPNLIIGSETTSYEEARWSLLPTKFPLKYTVKLAEVFSPSTIITTWFQLVSADVATNNLFPEPIGMWYLQNK